MGLQDLIITPIYLILFLLLAFLVRNRFTNSQTRKFFIPALVVRFIGAIMLGIIYQFYYNGGDTFNFWDHGSKWVWEAFLNNPYEGMRLLFKTGSVHHLDLYQYSSNIWYYRDPASYFIIRVATVFDIFTLHTYSATALFFAVFNFSGIWALFSAIQMKYPQSTKWLAYGVLFFPSMVFWGSGILKDTVSLGALGWMTWALVRWLDLKIRTWVEVVIFILNVWIISIIKVYILICFLPAIGIWLFLKQLGKIRNIVLRILVAPILILVFALSGILAVRQINESEAYSLENLAETAKITAYDIRYGWGARLGGEGGYDIGLPDGTWESMVTLMPKAIIVSIFRPYPWEIRTPFMLLAAIEALIMLWLTFRLLVLKSQKLKYLWSDPFCFFCISFALLFAFAVGVSTFNFGTLMRYKIPLIPYFVTAAVCLPDIRKYMVVKKSN